MSNDWQNHIAGMIGKGETQTGGGRRPRLTDGNYSLCLESLELKEDRSKRPYVLLEATVLEATTINVNKPATPVGTQIGFFFNIGASKYPDQEIGNLRKLILSLLDWTDQDVADAAAKQGQTAQQGFSQLFNLATAENQPFAGRLVKAETWRGKEKDGKEGWLNVNWGSAGPQTDAEIAQRRAANETNTLAQAASPLAPTVVPPVTQPATAPVVSSPSSAPPVQPQPAPAPAAAPSMFPGFGPKS